MKVLGSKEVLMLHGCDGNACGLCLLLPELPKEPICMNVETDAPEVVLSLSLQAPLSRWRTAIYPNFFGSTLWYMGGKLGTAFRILHFP